MSEYGHDEAMRDRGYIAKVLTERWADETARNHAISRLVRLAAYIERLEQKQDWLAEQLGRHLGAYRDKWEWIKDAEEATSDEG